MSGVSAEVCESAPEVAMLYPQLCLSMPAAAPERPGGDLVAVGHELAALAALLRRSQGVVAGGTAVGLAIVVFAARKKACIHSNKLDTKCFAQKGVIQFFFCNFYRSRCRSHVWLASTRLCKILNAISPPCAWSCPKTRSGSG